jgi:hypothetical protein
MSALTRAAAGKYVDRRVPTVFSDRHVDHDYEVSGAGRGKTLMSLAAMPVTVEKLPEPPTATLVTIEVLPVNISGSTSSINGVSGGVWSNTSSFLGISGGVWSNSSVFSGQIQVNVPAFAGNVVSFLENGTTAAGLSYEPLTFGTAIAIADPADTRSDPAEGPSLSACLELLDSRRGLLRAHEVAGLERQLRVLLSDESELEDIVVSRASLDGLIAFLARHQPSTHPNVSLNRAGHFTASWSPRPRAKLTFCFSATNADTADWVGVDLTPVPAVRGSGAVVIGSLDGIAMPFRTWVAS